MGVQKDLATAKKDLETVKKLIEKPDVVAAKKTLETISKLVLDIEKADREKRKKIEEGISKLADAVNSVLAIVNKKPFDGSKAIDLITKATTAATVAEQAVKPAP